MRAHAERVPDLVQRDPLDLVRRQQAEIIREVELDLGHVEGDVERPVRGIAAAHATGARDRRLAEHLEIRVGRRRLLAEQAQLADAFARIGRTAVPGPVSVVTALSSSTSAPSMAAMPAARAA